MEKKKYLFVVAHPDDELLGAGATMLQLVEKGHSVHVCVLSGRSPTRDDDIVSVMLATHKIIGVESTIIGEFGCMKFKDEDHHTMVRFVENAIRSTRPHVLVMQHPTDLHNDHYIASLITQEAARLPQRQIGYDGPKIEHIGFMEVPSETDFALNSAWGPFTPNCFVPVDRAHMQKKIELLSMYDNVIRMAPHPRSEHAIFGLAATRGTSCGVKYAEAFQTVMKIGV